jgi:hypothetical protein
MITILSFVLGGFVNIIFLALTLLKSVFGSKPAAAAE